MSKCARCTIVLSLLTLTAMPAHAGMLETYNEGNSIEFSPLHPPSIFDGGVSDFSVMCWIRRTAWEEGQYSNIADGNAVLNFGFDDAADGVLFQLHGTPMDINLLVPLRDGSPESKVPVDEWMLVAASFDADEGRLTGWAQSESVGRVAAADTVPGWSGDEPWPLTLGATTLAPAFVGQIGLLVFRDHEIDESDFDAVFSGGAPHYFAPALLDSGNMTGFDGIEWMIGHGVITAPKSTINPNSEGAELGDVVTANNLLVYNRADSSDCYCPGLLSAVVGTWRLRSPHEAGEPWSGFFVRQLPDLGMPGDYYVQCVSPKAKQLADNTPTGLIRVIASANSRAVRVSTNFYDYLMDQWALGGVYGARKSTTAGVIISAGPCWARWPFMRYTGKVVGTVNESWETPFNSVAFGNFASNGRESDYFPSYHLAGRALVIEDGSSFIPKTRPESGTQFDDRTDPVTVRAMLVRFPGAGDVVYLGEKAKTQSAADHTNEGDPVTLPLDTTVRTYVMSPGDSYDSGTLQLTLAGVMDDIEAGHGCFISDGAGKDGISMIVDVDTSGGTSTVITLEKKFPTHPDPGSSTLKFGAVEPIWVAHEWSGLAPDDPEIYRGIRLTASGGIVVVLFFDCFNPEADGFVIGPIGRSGCGYERQLLMLFNENGVLMMQGLAADVWLQFFAHQNSEVQCMADYTMAIREGSPLTEVWWCGDPDFDTDTDDVENTDSWQSYILENAAANGVGAIVAHEHPKIGVGFERAADGQVANQHHASARGCHLYLEAVLEMMREAALDEGSPCPWDLDENGMVDTADLLSLLADWGPCGLVCPADFDGDGQVGTSDLLALLGAWGPCDRA